MPRFLTVLDVDSTLIENEVIELLADAAGSHAEVSRITERAMAGDPAARTLLVEEIYRPLQEAGSALLETLSVYLEQASSLEGAARMLFVHPNTVRYRLRRVTDVTGWSPSDVRSAFTLRIALMLGRLADEDLHA